MSLALAAALAKLLENACATLPASAFTVSQRRALDEMARKTGALRVKTEGSGSVYQALNADLLSVHLKSLRPASQDEIDPDIPRRAANIAHARNSKSRAHGHELHYLLVKASSEDVCWEKGQGGAGRVLDLSALTATAGAGVLALCEEDDWHSGQALWLVENQALFDRLDWMPKGVQGTLAYYAGHLPTRVLQWLAARRRVPEVVLFPDYDGVGLLNYARLREVCASPCSFWLMPGWPSLLARYGSNEIWRNTQAEFHAAVARLEAAGMEDGLRDLCLALSQQGLALEHEAVWLASNGSPPPGGAGVSPAGGAAKKVTFPENLADEPKMSRKEPK